ncbi:MAG: acylneuraminate cytidylyltransferase family protein [Elusimicrobia bacterium]|nr:acylneuraminate cytidylyltransferase family protein [Elusimicrobiota bacterium]
MEDKPYVVAVVHARGESSRVPGKNLKPIRGVPLVAWITRAAKASKKIDRLIVSSDDEEIIRIAKESGAEAPFVRPAPLTKDIPADRITRHAVDYVEKQEGGMVQIAVTLYPTAPFCATADIDRCIDLLLENHDLDSAYTVRPVRDLPYTMIRVKDNRAVPFLRAEPDSDGEQSSLYVPAGGVVATRRAVLFDYEKLVGDSAGIVEVPSERAFTINDASDFRLAETLADTPSKAA